MPVPTTSPNDLTRQQLDELDALLQRMLSLPLNKPADPPPSRLPDPPVPSTPRLPRTDPPAPAPPPHMVIPPPRPEPVVVTATVPVATVSEMRSYTPPAPKSFDFPPPERLFGPPTAETGIAPPAEPVTPFEPVDVSVSPTIEDDPAPVLLTPGDPAPEPRPGVPVMHWPVFGVNWLLEHVLKVFGPPGQALCSPAAKVLLGWGGLLLLVGAAAWVARGMGWIHFDWPR